jgi:DegV family protein with EDD domain
MGFGVAVIEAAKEFKAGKEFGSVVYKVNQMLSSTASYLAIPTLKYLRKRKKIGGFKSLMGMTLGVKPVLGFEDGKLAVKTRLFGKQPNMILSMLDMIKQDISGSPITLAIAHGRDLNVVINLKNVFEETFDCREVFRTYFGPSIAINAGPEAIGVMYYKH